MGSGANGPDLGSPGGGGGRTLVDGYSTEELELLVDYLTRARELLQRHRARLRGLDSDAGEGSMDVAGH